MLAAIDSSRASPRRKTNKGQRAGSRVQVVTLTREAGRAANATLRAHVHRVQYIRDEDLKGKKCPIPSSDLGETWGWWDPPTYILAVVPRLMAMACASVHIMSAGRRLDLAPEVTLSLLFLSLRGRSSDPGHT
jgi:hypothetical protein